jgi:hypothetical protein
MIRAARVVAFRALTETRASNRRIREVADPAGRQVGQAGGSWLGAAKAVRLATSRGGDRALQPACVVQVVCEVDVAFH